MARRAGGRESRGYVVWIRRCRVYGLMAAVAIGRRAREVVVHVAARASHAGVCTGQRERGLTVIEGRSRPRGRVVAHRTILRESGGRMIRVRRALVLRLMTRITGRAQVREVVIDVAGGASDAGVCTRQRKWCAVVIERRARPV